MTILVKDLKYAAGVLDGCGSILMNHSYIDGDTSRYYLYPKIRIVAPKGKIPVVIKMQELFGGSISRYDANRAYWTVSNKKAISTLSLLRPHLRNKTKLKKAIYILDNWETYKPHGRGGTLTLEEFNKRQQFYKGFKRIK